MSEAAQPPETGIIESYRKHYAATFARHGATSRGVDWGEWPDVHVRYEKMLEVIRARRSEAAVPTLLDVGCGFGGLLDYANEHSVALDYVGIDLVPDMIEHARTRHPGARFIVGDILNAQELPRVDYAVCNGILTLKLEASIIQMDRFAQQLIRRMLDRKSVV